MLAAYLDYAKERTSIIRRLADMAKVKLEKCIDIVKAPLQMTHQRYVTVNYGTTRSAEENDLVTQLVNGGVDAIQQASTAAATGKWSNFASEYFKNTKKIINTFTGGKGFGGGDEITDSDLYLLSFIMIESRHGQLESRALSLLLRSEEICSGLLSPSVTSLIPEILPMESAKLMVKKLDEKLYPKFQINISPEDLYKGAIAISRAVSEKALRIFYTFEKIPRDQEIVKREWNGIFKYLLDEVKSFKNGAELVETLKSWTGAALNSVGAETGQWIFHGANVILGLAALRFGAGGNPNPTGGTGSEVELQPLNNPQSIGMAQIRVFQQLSQLVAQAQQLGPNGAAALQAVLGLQAQIQELAFQLQQKSEVNNENEN